MDVFGWFPVCPSGKIVNTVNDKSDPLALANELRPILLHLHRHLRRELAPLGITAGQAALLHAVRTNPRAGVRALAEREGVSPPGMTAAIDRLEAMGLVHRARSPTDRRRVRIEVTEDGVRVLRSARSRRTAWLAARLARLTLRDREAVRRALPALSELVDESP
jgi:DNA-binding MarR family transcriptional regulator